VPASFGSGATAWGSPIGDIEFNAAGDRILLAEAGYREWTSSSGIMYINQSPHRGRVLEYSGSTGSWALDTGLAKYGIGEISGGKNARGGVDWGYESVITPVGGVVGNEDFIVANTDAFNLGSHSNGTTFNVYGIQFTPSSGGNVDDSIGADIDYDTNAQDKNIYADIDVYTLPIKYDLALIKVQTALSANPAVAGTQVSYRITVMNQGAVDSGSFTVEDIIPAGMSYVSATPAPTSAPAPGSGGVVQWVVPTSSELAVGASANFDIVLQVDDVGLSPFKNIAEITAE